MRDGKDDVSLVWLKSKPGMNEVMHTISYLKSYSKDPKRFNPFVSSVTLEERNGNLCYYQRMDFKNHDLGVEVSSAFTFQVIEKPKPLTKTFWSGKMWWIMENKVGSKVRGFKLSLSFCAVAQCSEKLHSFRLLSQNVFCGRQGESW